MKNPNCDNEYCLQENGTVKVLPIGGDSNAILCWACFLHEMAFRRERNKELGIDCQFKLPTWESLETYKTGE